MDGNAVSRFSLLWAFMIYRNKFKDLIFVGIPTLFLYPYYIADAFQFDSMPYYPSLFYLLGWFVVFILAVETSSLVRSVFEVRSLSLIAHNPFIIITDLSGGYIIEGYSVKKNKKITIRKTIPRKMIHLLKPH